MTQATADTPDVKAPPVEVIPPEVTEKDRKKKREEEEDKRLKENEIKYGLRYKLIFLFSIIILIVALGITFIATGNQAESLMKEKQKQGRIIVRGLTAAIKTRLLDLYASSADKLRKIKDREGFNRFYKDNELALQIFEDIDQVKTQPDVVYAYILGNKNIVLGHTDTEIQPYSEYKFYKGTDSYFSLYRKKKLNQPEPILNTIRYTYKARDEKGKIKEQTIEVVDFAYLMAFKNNPSLDDAIGEVHIGISLETVNSEIFHNKVQLQLVGIGAIVVGILVAVVFATFLSGPIRRMIEGMQQVSQGNFHASVLVKAKDEVGLLSRTFNIMLKGMSILVSPEVAQVVLAGGDLTQSGEKKVVTVLFSDIRSFTTISESLTPNQVVMMLNDYMEIMTDIIIKYGGVVDKFVGDEIFAVFGAPFDHPMHPLCASATAIEMGVELAKHNTARGAEGKPPIQIGIGVNTGDVIAGAMGSSKRVDYTSIGDAVNLGARLEGTNKVYGTLAICSEFTYEVIKDDVIVRELDLIKVKGKNKPVTIYELVEMSARGQAKIDKYLSEKAEREEKARRGGK